MIGLPDDVREKPVDPDDPGHDADRDPRLLEHGALLDMQLDVAVQPVRPARLCELAGRAAACLERLGEGPIRPGPSKAR